MYQNRSRGFTLIELLVVIAIIGILSAVVLASLNTARSKGADAAIQSNLDGIRVQAELYYDGTGATGGDNSYGADATACTGTTDSMWVEDTTIARAIVATESANGSGDVVCNSTATAYAVQSPLVSVTTDLWCVDSTGVARKSITALGTGTTVCP